MDKLDQLILAHASRPDLVSNVHLTDMNQLRPLNDKLRFFCPLDNGRHESMGMGTASLGILDRLPTEIVITILMATDVRSLTDLRAVNKYSRAFVDCLPVYKEVVKYTPDVLRAVLICGVARRFSIEHLYTVLTDPTCGHCSDFGWLLYLPACVRACYSCLADRDEVLPLTIPEAQEMYGLDKETLDGLPTIRSLPIQSPFIHSMALLDTPSVVEAAVTHHGSREAMQDRLEKTYDLLREHIRKDPSLEAHYRLPSRLYQDAHWMRATVCAPWIDIRNRRVDWGVSCTRCAWRGITNPILTQPMYLAHARTCALTRALLRSVAPEEAEEAGIEDGEPIWDWEVATWPLYAPKTEKEIWNPHLVVRVAMGMEPSEAVECVSRLGFWEQGVYWSVTG